MELFTEGLTKRELKQAADYLAVIHVTGGRPKGMHTGSTWHTTVLLGSEVSRRGFTLVPEALPLIAGHPLVASVDALKAQGYFVDGLGLAARSRWTISDGVPMYHTDDSRTLVVALDGSARQLDGPDGRWVGQPLGNPGQEVRA